MLLQAALISAMHGPLKMLDGLVFMRIIITGAAALPYG